MHKHAEHKKQQVAAAYSTLLVASQLALFKTAHAARVCVRLVSLCHETLHVRTMQWQHRCQNEMAA